jgi:hypothetical protein
MGLLARPQPVLRKAHPTVVLGRPQEPARILFDFVISEDVGAALCLQFLLFSSTCGFNLGWKKEEWRAKLEVAIDCGLQDSRDDDSELEQEAFRDAFEQCVEDSNERPPRPRWGGSRIGQQYVHRNREVDHDRLFHDYFSDNPTYDSVKFLSIVYRVCAYDEWFVQRPDVVGRMGLSSLQKCTAALRMLAYGVAVDATDEYVWLGASTADEALCRFCIAIRVYFESTFLQQPSRKDLVKQISINTA